LVKNLLIDSLLTPIVESTYLVNVTKRPIDANIQRLYLLGFKELSFNILETRK